MYGGTSRLENYRGNDPHRPTDACEVIREMVELLQQAGMEEDDGPWWSRRNAVLAKVKTEA